MDSKRIDKFTTAWSAMGTLGMLAASAALAAPAQRSLDLPRPQRAAGPASTASPASMDDAQLAQFVADARALWPGLSPEVRSMVLELVRSRSATAP
jgi:hypothetical protein